MKILVTGVFLFLTLNCLAIAQDVDIPVKDFEKQIPKLTNGYIYAGDDTLIALRSCRIIWIGVSFGAIKFNKRDSTLSISGHLYDDARLEKPAINQVQIMVGKFQVNPDDAGKATFTMRDKKSLGNSSYFYETFKLKTDEYICFAMDEQEKLEIQDLLNQGDITRVLLMGWVKLYKVGALFN